MKYVKDKKFNEITAMDNYSGLGLKAFRRLERGEAVELKNPKLKKGFIKKKEKWR